jgi:hypothetical protein
LYVKIRVLKRNPPKEITIGKFEKMLEDWEDKTRTLWYTEVGSSRRSYSSKKRETIGVMVT